MQKTMKMQFNNNTKNSNFCTVIFHQKEKNRPQIFVLSDVSFNEMM